MLDEAYVRSSEAGDFEEVGDGAFWVDGEDVQGEQLLERQLSELGSKRQRDGACCSGEEEVALTVGGEDDVGGSKLLLREPQKNRLRLAIVLKSEVECFVVEYFEVLWKNPSSNRTTWTATARSSHLCGIPRR